MAAIVVVVVAVVVVAAPTLTNRQQPEQQQQEQAIIIFENLEFRETRIWVFAENDSVEEFSGLNETLAGDL